MEFWHSNGYSATNDPHDLDRDNDGLPCEVKKGDYDQFLASKQPTKKMKTNHKSKLNRKILNKNLLKQENTQQNNQATTNKQEQTKQTAVKAETKKQGEKVA